MIGAIIGSVALIVMLLIFGRAVVDWYSYHLKVIGKKDRTDGGILDKMDDGTLGKSPSILKFEEEI